jgi:hypothetical protein
MFWPDNCSQIPKYIPSQCNLGDPEGGASQRHGIEVPEPVVRNTPCCQVVEHAAHNIHASGTRIVCLSIVVFCGGFLVSRTIGEEAAGQGRAIGYEQNLEVTRSFSASSNGDDGALIPLRRRL